MISPYHRYFHLVAALISAPGIHASPSSHRQDTVVLDSTGVKNLRIETVAVSEGDFEETVFALGLLEAKPTQQASVSSRISGRLVALGVAPGDAVVAGTEIARVESRQPGSPPAIISLTAPLSGLVTQLDVRLGDPVEPERALLQITDLREVFALARIPEHLAGRLQTGTQAHIAVAALGEDPVQGELLRFGTAADPASGTIDAFFHLPNPGLRLRPGMRAEFSIVIARRTGVMSIPRSALQGDAASRFVYVKDFDLPNAFIKTPIVVGQINERFVEVISGLLPADEVVTQGAYSLAFAGGSSGLSLKEALDAAHGHEHAEDGSELTDAQKKASAQNSSPADTHAHGDPHAHDEPGHSSRFWMIVSGVLFVALLVVGFLKRGSSAKTSQKKS